MSVRVQVPPRVLIYEKPRRKSWLFCFTQVGKAALLRNRRKIKKVWPEGMAFHTHQVRTGLVSAMKQHRLEYLFMKSQDESPGFFVLRNIFLFF
ncbi:hypothetical protein DMZ48_08080 [Robertkochia solimangrovi]|nr:hypothetical protein DMZ48_08080 [Robertkochia solimangrovi]